MSTELRVEHYSLTKIICLQIINKNRNMSRTDKGKELETNEDKQKNEV